MGELRCTYRLRLGSGLGFREARALVPDRHDLGVSHLYLSPAFQARAGSTHGYDVVGPTRISEELGGEDEFRALCGAGVGVVLDVVPNHMAAADENPFWRDPLWRANVLRPRLADGVAPALLRRRRARGGAAQGSGGVGADAPQGRRASPDARRGSSYPKERSHRQL